MMKTSKFLLALAYGLLIVACQTPPPPAAEVEAPAPPAPVVEAVAEAPVVETPAPVVVEPDSIQATRDGFSPRASVPNNTILLQIHWSQVPPVTEWAVKFVLDQGDIVRTLRGTDSVPTITWDGKNDAGGDAPQGRYHALLQTAGADGVLVDRDTSEPFVLDLVPPTGTITASPVPFVPGPGTAIVTGTDVLTIQVSIVSGGAPWTTWRLGVLHPDGRRFRDFINEEHRDNRITWSGRALNNAQLEAGVTYRLEAEVFDIYGNRGVLVGSLPVGFPPAPEPVAVPALPPPQPAHIQVTLDGRLLAELPIFFAPFSAALDNLTPERAEANQSAMKRLAELLDLAEGETVILVGHANQVLYEDPEKAAYEQQETLIPLSLNRAETVRQALVEEGIPMSQMLTGGVGAADPWAPFSDPEKRWMNRRVVVELPPSKDSK